MTSSFDPKTERKLIMNINLALIQFILFLKIFCIYTYISLTSSNNQFSEFRIFCLFTFLLIFFVKHIFFWSTFREIFVKKLVNTCGGLIIEFEVSRILICFLFYDYLQEKNPTLYTFPIFMNLFLKFLLL